MLDLASLLRETEFYMPVSSYSFIEEARRIIGSGSLTEIACRNVISRAYYGLYHCALQHADTILTPPLSACGGGSHVKVSSFYSGHVCKTRDETVKYRKIGINLLQLHGQRVRSDYRLDENIDLADAEAVLVRCDSLFSELTVLGVVA